MHCIKIRMSKICLTVVQLSRGRRLEIRHRERRQEEIQILWNIE